jgi:hypothetical protein
MMTVHRHAGPVCSLIASLACAACGQGNAGGDPAPDPIDAPGTGPGPVDAARPVDAPSAPADAGIDAPARPTLRFDVAYINEIHMPSALPSLEGVLVIINESEVPISTAKLTVVSVIEDSPVADLRIQKSESVGFTLLPGHAAGALNAAAAARLAKSGLIDEPLDDQALDFTLSFGFAPPPGLKFKARVVLDIEGQRATLPFQFFITEDTTADPVSANRVSSSPSS